MKWSRFSSTSSNKPFCLLSVYSTDSGWDNPFRPDGDLSREADEIVNLIKGKFFNAIRKHQMSEWILFIISGGKPITPTGDQLLLNGNHTNGSHEANGKTVVDGATKLEVRRTIRDVNWHSGEAFTVALDWSFRLAILIDILQHPFLGVAASQSIKRYKITTESRSQRRRW